MNIFSKTALIYEICMGLNDYLSDTTINSFLQRYKYVFNLYFSEVP
ncbi:hypothetical protein SPHINGO8BC_60409 [Sphingobacterium multivorum]|uniref:Uncharacterized protein n=1 Tax=Sphingobacterium multivorum TaxID=28454 RepID=A0A654DL63_SPHMU|nr:hypothetical protein SPHINGO8BC_60409 [Sphingobacterium multivorum]